MYLLDLHQVGQERGSGARPEVDHHGPVLVLVLEEVQEVDLAAVVDAVERGVGGGAVQAGQLRGVLGEAGIIEIFFDVIYWVHYVNRLAVSHNKTVRWNFQYRHQYVSFNTIIGIYLTTQC